MSNACKVISRGLCWLPLLSSFALYAVLYWPKWSTVVLAVVCLFVCVSIFGALNERRTTMTAMAQTVYTLNLRCFFVVVAVVTALFFINAVAVAVLFASFGSFAVDSVCVCTRRVGMC